MDERITDFLASARSCALSPMEHAQVRAALAAETMKTEPSVLLRESSASILLTDYEKAISRARLLNFMRSNPLGSRGAAFFRMLSRPFTAAISSAVALSLIGGGLAYAAEGSLPGDLLYPIKVRITEPVISGLTLSPVARAQWNVRTIERRLNEADALSQESGTGDRKILLHSQMEEDVAHLGEHLKSLSEEDKKTVRGDLLSELAQHRESLLQVRENGIPSALKTLAKEAAAGPESPDASEGSSSSIEKERGQKNREEKPAKERRQAIIPPPDDGEDTESSSLSSSSEAMNSSSSGRKQLRIILRGDDDNLQEDDEEDFAPPLLRSPEESSSLSLPSSAAWKTEGSHDNEDPEEEDFR